MDYSLAEVAPIFLLPFIAFFINAAIATKLPKLVNWIAVAAIVGSFVFTLKIFMDFMGVYNADYYVHKTFTWIDLSGPAKNFKIDLGYYLDNMAVIMLLMVTGVASLIHIFSTWYMKGDSRETRFFVFLPLFTAAMIGCVLANNLLMLFIFWEIMGFCSYSLIGIYYEKQAAGNASLKAFMTTRVGDVFFLLGILAIWMVVGNVNYVDMYEAVANGSFEGRSILGISAVTFAAFCVFMGNIGKSAQFPLQVWLPDAMMGPTPGSALIHAATMVAAGCYLSLRLFPLYDAGGILPLVAIVGGITACGAATIALVQKDMKAVLAYSTISQLGYMVLGIGVGAYNAAFMHIITHAIFKACLFMSAGSVIHSIHEQMMPRLGGLRKKLPLTYISMLFCTLAIAGVPLWSGFVSKDRILGDALYSAIQGPWYYAIPAVLGFVGAMLTPFYMFRMIFKTFHGEPKDRELYDHCHQEHFKWNQNGPLLVLALFTFGFWFSGSVIGQGLAPVFGEQHEWFKVLVEPPVVEKFIDRKEMHVLDMGAVVPSTQSVYDHQMGYAGINAENEDALHHAHVYGAWASVVIVAFSIFLAFLMYIKRSVKPWADKFPGYTQTLDNKYYFDNLYIDIVIQKGLLTFNKALAWFDLGVYDRFFIDGWESVAKVFYRTSKWVDENIVDNIVDAHGFFVNLFNLILRYVQSGRVQFYFIVLIFVLASYITTINI